MAQLAKGSSNGGLSRCLVLYFRYRKRSNLSLLPALNNCSLLCTGHTQFLTEVIPLFNFTRNDLAQQQLQQIFMQPLGTREEIMERQQILKGFLSQLPVLEEYAYARYDLTEVHDFLSHLSGPEFLPQSRWEWTFLNKAERHHLQSRYKQTVLLFNKLHTHFFSRLSLPHFPETYHRELRFITGFLSGLQLQEHISLLQQQKDNLRNVRKFLTLLTARTNDGSLSAFWEKLFLFEAFLSISKGIKKQGFVFPEITENEFAVQGLIHPLLAEGIPYNFQVHCPVAVLSGPNMSGKSTFLKALALAVYLGHLGFAIPAEAAHIPLFEQLFLWLQHQDNLAGGYSHFMNEIMQLKAAVEAAATGQKCFAVFDELFQGTNETDALAVSLHTVKGLSRFAGSYFIISTHLQGLKEVVRQPGNNIAPWCFGCALKDGMPVFDYVLKEGWSEVKVGQLLFEKAGLTKLLGQREA